MDFVIIEGVRAKLLVQVTYAPGKPDVRARVHKALAKASEELGVRDALVITWDYLGEEEPQRHVPHPKAPRGGEVLPSALGCSFANRLHR